MAPGLRGWIEQSLFAALAFALLPLLNALTTERHLGRSPPRGDWVMAGFDLAMLVLGIVFGVIAWRRMRKARVAQGETEPARSFAATRHAESTE